LGQKKIFFIEMGATCAGHVTEKTTDGLLQILVVSPMMGKGKHYRGLLRKTDGNNLRQLPLGESRFPNDIHRTTSLLR
jgi:hypothetical protein